MSREIKPEDENQFFKDAVETLSSMRQMRLSENQKTIAIYFFSAGFRDAKVREKCKLTDIQEEAFQLASETKLPGQWKNTDNALECADAIKHLESVGK